MANRIDQIEREKEEIANKINEVKRQKDQEIENMN